MSCLINFLFWNQFFLLILNYSKYLCFLHLIVQLFIYFLIEYIIFIKFSWCIIKLSSPPITYVSIAVLFIFSILPFCSKYKLNMLIEFILSLFIILIFINRPFGSKASLVNLHLFLYWQL